MSRMKVYVFKSAKDAEVYGFTSDDTGSNAGSNARAPPDPESASERTCALSSAQARHGALADLFRDFLDGGIPARPCGQPGGVHGTALISLCTTTSTPKTSRRSAGKVGHGRDSGRQRAGQRRHNASLERASGQMCVVEVPL